MSRVKVTFWIEGDDPDHDTGVTTDTFDLISDAVMGVGGEDLEFEKEED